MARTLTASDRKSLIKLASTMAVGSPERKAILAGLSKKAGLPKSPSDAWDTYVGSEGVSDFMDGEDDAEDAVAAYAKGNEFFSDLSKSDAEKVKGMLVKYIEQTHKKASGSKEARYRSWGKSTSADVMNNWRSKDTPAEQRESLGQSMADAYEVIQTVLLLSKKTEGADPQSVNKALQAIGAAMFGH